MSGISDAETNKFRDMSNAWWDADGPFKALHAMSYTRLKYIVDAITAELNKITGLKILDVGCGGGLISVPLARLGAEVTGIDAVSESIDIAKDYINKACYKEALDIQYYDTTLERFAEEKCKDQLYDVIVASEVLEHVSNMESFISTLASMLKPSGLLFISTIAKTWASYTQAILCAEYLLRLVPIGTHLWSQFISHDELSALLFKYSFEVKQPIGMKYNIITNKWHFSGNLSVNYILYCKKIII